MDLLHAITKLKVTGILRQLDDRIGGFYNGRSMDDGLVSTDRQGDFCTYGGMGLSVALLVLRNLQSFKASISPTGGRHCKTSCQVQAGKFFLYSSAVFLITMLIDF